ncbi:hypothetical protein C4577_06560 [Candidatus Parcubacteria bacterium]|nr:MAG: hypothetical protein C4577_06560 [Candidatus Parcubacteria bacterium]
MDELRKIGKQIYEKYGSSEDGVKKLTQKILADPALIDLAIPLAADQILRTLQTEVRHNLKNPNIDYSPVKISKEYQQKLVAACDKLLMDWPMRNGSKIGDATRPDVLSEAAFYGKLRRANADNELFLNKVAAKLKDDHTTVRNALTEEELISIKKKVWANQMF